MLRFVSLSGGLDSAVLLYKVHEEAGPRDELIGVSFDYGQRHGKEIEYAKKQCDRLGAGHIILALDGSLGFRLFGRPLLRDKDAALPDMSYEEMPEGVSPTYVPFRNGLMISMLAALAHSKLNRSSHEGAQIHLGVHADDSARDAYPDCSYDFIHHMASAVWIATYRDVSVHAPFIHDSKKQIVERGASLNVPFADTWSCYAGGDLHCGKCPTCRARKQAFVKAGVNDPTKYAE